MCRGRVRGACYLLVSGVMGPVAVGLAGPRLLSEEEEETEPLRAETALEPEPAVPEDTHCDCLHAARVACRADLSGKAPSKYHRHPNTSILTTKERSAAQDAPRQVLLRDGGYKKQVERTPTRREIEPYGSTSDFKLCL
jgi:hypothetical protein